MCCGGGCRIFGAKHAESVILQTTFSLTIMWKPKHHAKLSYWQHNHVILLVETLHALGILALSSVTLAPFHHLSIEHAQCWMHCMPQVLKTLPANLPSFLFTSYSMFTFQTPTHHAVH